jgi:putative transposase
MNARTPTYKRHRFPPDIIQRAVWLFIRFNLSHRDIEDLLAQRGIDVCRESIWRWCNKFGPTCARRLQRAHRGYCDTFFLDEVFVKIQGKQQYLWRAVEQDGEVVDVFVQARRDVKAAMRFFRRLLKRHGDEPRKIVTDKLRSYGVARRELIPEAIRDTSQYANNRAELSHQPNRVRERGMRCFKSRRQAQRFLDVHAAVYTLFNLSRHLMAALTAVESACVPGPLGTTSTAWKVVRVPRSTVPSARLPRVPLMAGRVPAPGHHYIEGSESTLRAVGSIGRADARRGTTGRDWRPRTVSSPHGMRCSALMHADFALGHGHFSAAPVRGIMCARLRRLRPRTWALALLEAFHFAPEEAELNGREGAQYALSLVDQNASLMGQLVGWVLFGRSEEAAPIIRDLIEFVTVREFSLIAGISTFFYGLAMMQMGNMAVGEKYIMDAIKESRESKACSASNVVLRMELAAISAMAAAKAFRV